MPKERRDHSSSFDRSRASPFPCSSSRSRKILPENPSEQDENMKEWEEARCPVCMEHPHNAVLLICSSHEKGCRPFMCDTSYRHSNCFDQFRKSSSEASTTAQPENATVSMVQFTSSMMSETTVSTLQDERSEDGSPPGHSVSCENQMKPKLVCPLCRGQITGWTIVESARHFMNAKSRNCASETCDFSGTYKDLRKHARLEHPSVRPSEADPERQRSWRRLERQRDLGDLISTLQSSMDEERTAESSLLIDEEGWLTVFFLIRVFRPGSTLRSNSWSGASRARAQVPARRRSTRLWGETHDEETGSVARDNDNESSEDSLGPWRRRGRVRQRPTPDNEL